MSLADLHLHSRHSDGALRPEALVELAAARGVTRLALTDHDTVAGLPEAARACAAHGLAFVPGVELSATWRGQVIHVLGLGLDAASQALAAHLTGQRDRRRERLLEIGRRLQKRARLPGEALAAGVLAQVETPTRAHLAQALVEAGHADSVQECFDRWLGRGLPGHVPEEWPSLADTIAVLRACGAQSALAHPHRCRVSNGALRQLVAEFRDAGGAALEVSSGNMSASDLDRVATLARGHGLAATAGSDFHDPALPWQSPGRFAKLPADLRPM